VNLITLRDGHGTGFATVTGQIQIQMAAHSGGLVLVAPVAAGAPEGSREAGGHFLPAGEHGARGAAVCGASGLAGFIDAGLVQDAAGPGEEGFQSPDAGGAVVAGDGEDDLCSGGGEA
jgi:hypothetical protein